MGFIGGIWRVSGLCANGAAGGLMWLLARPPVIPLEFTLPVGGPVTADLDCVPQACQRANDNIRLTVLVVDQAGEPISVRDASAKTLVLLRPDGTTQEVAASFLTSGIDGGLIYDTVAGDLPQTGTYQLQARYVIAGKTQTTRWAKFRVGANLDD